MEVDGETVSASSTPLTGSCSTSASSSAALLERKLEDDFISERARRSDGGRMKGLLKDFHLFYQTVVDGSEDTARVLTQKQSLLRKLDALEMHSRLVKHKADTQRRDLQLFEAEKQRIAACDTRLLQELAALKLDLQRTRRLVTERTECNEMEKAICKQSERSKIKSQLKALKQQMAEETCALSKLDADIEVKRKQFAASYHAFSALERELTFDE